MLSFSRFKKPDPLSPYAFSLRKKLLQGTPMEELWVLNDEHEAYLKKVKSNVNESTLPLKERFALNFMQDVKILRTDFKEKKPPGQGVFRDLNEVMENVARYYFTDMKPLPKVTWLKHFSTRKLAHYHFEKDEVAISLIFDSLRAPAKLIQYLVYHELLHKEVGIVQKNGKRYAHTPEFKEREQEYRDFEEIEKEITKYLRFA